MVVEGGNEVFSGALTARFKGLFLILLVNLFCWKMDWGSEGHEQELAKSST